MVISAIEREMKMLSQIQLWEGIACLPKNFKYLLTALPLFVITMIILIETSTLGVECGKRRYINSVRNHGRYLQW